MKDRIDNNIIYVLMDFLSGRNFKVKMGSSYSSSKNLQIGCVQGSILGPKLFTLYTSQIPSVLPDDCFVVSYADDTYVALSGKDMTDLKNRLEHTMSNHDSYLGAIGMVTNVDKTELLNFSRRKIKGPTLMVNNKQVYPSETLKVLGVKFQPDLSWDTHIRETISRLRSIIKKPYQK